MKKIIVSVIIVVVLTSSLYFLVPKRNIMNVDYVLTTQKNSLEFIKGKLDYEINVNRNIISDDDVSLVIKINNTVYHLHNSHYNDFLVKYSNRPYSISNHDIDTNGDSVTTMWGYLSKDLEKMVIYVNNEEEEYSLYIPAVDENDIKDIQNKILIDFNE